MKMKNALLILIIVLFVNCAAPAPDTSNIRPLVKEFLVALSRHDMTAARVRATDAFVTNIGGEDALTALMDCHAAFLVPNLFEFESPQPDGSSYHTRAYLHDGKCNMLPLDIWVVATDSGWKVDRLLWHQPVKER